MAGDTKLRSSTEAIEPLMKEAPGVYRSLVVADSNQALARNRSMQRAAGERRSGDGCGRRPPDRSRIRVPVPLAPRGGSWWKDRNGFQTNGAALMTATTYETLIVEDPTTRSG